VGLPSKFSYPAAFGDFGLRFWRWLRFLQRWKSSRLLVWIFNVEGTVDLTAITLATIYSAAPYMGAAYWIPAFWVPARW
jgi:hypothetical protein